MYRDNLDSHDKKLVFTFFFSFIYYFLNYETLINYCRNNKKNDMHIRVPRYAMLFFSLLDIQNNLEWM